MRQTVPSELGSAQTREIDVAAATDMLFAEIANAAGDALFADQVRALNTQMSRLRPYEAALIPDRDQEFAALSACWSKRDLPRLRQLVQVYFQRRQAIVPELVKLINVTH